MGFIAPDQSALEQLRDQALCMYPRLYPLSSCSLMPANHNDFWSQNGHQPEDGTFFPGFEAGWHAAIEKLQNGEELPGDLEQWAKDSGSHHWEFEHGFRQGAEAARGAGHHEEDQQDQQEEEHHDEE